MEKEAEKAKNVRRAAKSAFTRAINTTQLLLDDKRPPSEICDEFEKVKVVHADLTKSMKHTYRLLHRKCDVRIFIHELQRLWKTNE